MNTLSEKWNWLTTRVTGNNTTARICLAGAACIGMGILLYGMRLGPGVGGDATIYIYSAQNLIHGKGLGLIGPAGEFRLIPYFPPFFSLVLAVFGLIGIDMTAAAMGLNTLLFGGTIYLAGALTWRFSRDLFASLLIALLMAGSPVLIPIYSWAMSEPLSIFLGFAGFGCILLFLEKPAIWIYILYAALLSGFSFLTRYSSVSFLGAGILVILFLGKDRWLKKAKDSLVYGVVGSLPMCAWLVYDFSMTATVASRRMESILGVFERVTGFWQNFQELFLFWIIPESWIYSSAPYPTWINPWLFILFWLGLTVLFLFVIRRLTVVNSEGLRKLALALGLFILVYIGVVAVISFTTYPPITIANRMFSPVHIAVLWLLIILLSLGRMSWPGGQKIFIILLVGMLLFNAAYIWRTARIVGQYRKSGLGYNSEAWRSSPTITALQSLPTDKAFITNETMAVLYLTGRTSHPFMEIYWPVPGKVFSVYGEGDLSSDNSQRLFRQEGSPLVLFDTIYDQMSQLYGDLGNERVKRLTGSLYAAFQGHDGVIYYYSQPGDNK